MIFNIQPYSTHDRPAIRTLLFLKACSLRSPSSQNPQTP
ncbi:glycyl-radical enzyme activating protein, partial [Providencia rettgeri]